MPQIILRTEIAAPVLRCFDLSRSIDLHQLSTAKTNERAIDGKTHGLIEVGETVTWHAKHFGLWLTLTSKITALDAPNYFIDEMIQGPFRSLHHTHEFKVDGDKTIMTDIFEFSSPAGVLGKIVDRFILTSYLKGFLTERNATIKQYAEGDQWKLLLEEQ